MEGGRANASRVMRCLVFFFQAEDGIRDYKVTGVQTCALPIWLLTEEAAIPGRGKQKHTLAAATLAKDLLTFRDLDRPDDLQVRIELAAGAMVFQIGRASCRERV